MQYIPTIMRALCRVAGVPEEVMVDLHACRIVCYAAPPRHSQAITYLLGLEWYGMVEKAEAESSAERRN
jgi:hypothetical protein